MTAPRTVYDHQATTVHGGVSICRDLLINGREMAKMPAMPRLATTQLCESSWRIDGSFPVCLESKTSGIRNKAHPMKIGNPITRISWRAWEDCTVADFIPKAMKSRKAMTNGMVSPVASSKARTQVFPICLRLVMNHSRSPKGPRLITTRIQKNHPRRVMLNPINKSTILVRTNPSQILPMTWL